MGVRALIDGFFLQWLEETTGSRSTAVQGMCARAILRYLGAAEALAEAS